MIKNWKKRDGTIIAISDMETDHIKKCISLLHRNGFCSTEDFVDAVASAASLNGEYAKMTAENELAYMKPTRTLDAFYSELARRGC